MPFRDFTEPAGPGSFYWLAFCFRLFGIGFGTSRTVLLLTAVAITLLVFHLSRRIGASGYFAAAFVSIMTMPSTIMNSPHYDSNVLVLSGFAVFVSAERRIYYEESPRGSAVGLLFISGVLTGLADCFLQAKGACMAIAFALTLLILHRRRGFLPILTVFSGWACGFGAELVWYLHKGAFHDLLYANWLWPLSGYNAVNAVTYGFPLWNYPIG